MLTSVLVVGYSFVVGSSSIFLPLRANAETRCRGKWRARSSVPVVGFSLFHCGDGLCGCPRCPHAVLRLRFARRRQCPFRPLAAGWLCSVPVFCCELSFVCFSGYGSMSRCTASLRPFCEFVALSGTAAAHRCSSSSTRLVFHMSLNTITTTTSGPALPFKTAVLLLGWRATLAYAVRDIIRLSSHQPLVLGMGIWLSGKRV